MRQRFSVDLTEIEGDGEFTCPTCGQIISPDDESGLTYDILEVEKTDGEATGEIVVQCRKCGSVIHITGFGFLREIGYPEDLHDLDDYLGFRVDLET